MNIDQEQHEKEGPSVYRLAALSLAVVHHGMANLSEEAVPAGWASVCKTSNKFLAWLGGHAPEDENAR